MRPSDLALFRIPGAPAVSPDGRFAVVDVTRLALDADDYRAQLWLVPTDGTVSPRPLTHGWQDSAPRFSPDGRWLAFVRAAKDDKPQLHVMPVDGGEARPVTTREHHPLGVRAPAWSPDSRRVAYVARVPEPGRYGTEKGVGPDKEPPRRVTVLNYRLDDVGYTTDRRLHVFVVDPFADDPQPAQVTGGDYDHDEVTWSPDGRLIAFASARHAARDTTETNDVFVCAPDGSELRRLTRTREFARQLAFSPDGRTLFYTGEDLGEDGRDFPARSPGLYAVPVDGSTAPLRLTDEEPDHLGGHPLPTTEGVLGAFERRGSVELRLLPSDGTEPKPIVDGPRQVMGYDHAGGVTVATIADPGTVGELVALRDGGERTLTSFGAEFAGHAGIRPLEEIEATAPDGYPVHGWVVRPDGVGPHPVLLMIHGGPYTQYGWRLFDEAQVYAGAGYAVVMGNPRGSSGYGRAHGLAIRHDVGERSAADVLALLEHAVQAPDLDGDRVGVLGGSHGGYMTTWLVGHTDRFRAAISERAVNAIDSFAGSSDCGWVFPDQYYGTTAELTAVQSPLTSADRIRTPLLIIHSEQDLRCPFEQAQRLFVTLKKAGAEVEMLVFPGEGHELSRSGLPSHRVARFDAVLDWWRRHL
ncbi:MAG: S9 family peptidase [Streptosporangiaceae bacterium]